MSQHPNATPSPYRFHAYEISYFSAKVRPALRYKQLWVDEVRADFAEIQKRTGHIFIPMIVTPEGDTWQDSTLIFERLETTHPTPRLFPSRPLHCLIAHLVELYTDEFALIPAMHTRWGSELGESSARARFIAMMGDASQGTRAAQRMLQARNAVGAGAAASSEIEAHLHDLLAALSKHFEAHSYLLGERMSFADCALMGPLDGHFFNDLVSRRLLLETAPAVVGWIERCRYPNSDAQGKWFPGDDVPPSLIEVLGVMGRDAAPVLLDGLAVLDAWADSAPRGEEIPRVAGRIQTQLRGTKIERAALPYTMWMAQRSRDFHRAISAEQRERADAALTGTGWEPLLAYTPRHRLLHRDFRLTFE